MKNNMREFKQHLKENYPVLIDPTFESSKLLSEDRTDVIHIHSLYIGKKVKSQTDTKQRTNLNLTKNDFVEENVGHVFSLYYRPFDGKIDKEFKLFDFLGKQYKSLQNHHYDINENIKKNETIIYNTPIKALGWDVRATALTNEQYKKMCLQFENDKYLQKHCRTYYDSKILSDNEKPKTFNPEKVRKHIKKNYKELIFGSNLNKDEKVIYVKNIHLGKQMLSLTNTNGKTYFHSNKEDFVEEGKPFSLYRFVVTGMQRYDTKAIDKDDKEFKTTGCLHGFFNEDIKIDDQVIYNYPLTDFCPTGINAASVLGESAYNNLINKLEQDEFMQNACKYIYNTKYLTKEEHNELNEEKKF